MNYHRLLLTPAAAVAAIAFTAGTAAANQPVLTADCAGAAVTIPVTVTGTRIDLAVDGTVVATVTQTVDKAPTALSAPTPSPAVPHVWTATVTNPWDPTGNSVHTVNIGACVTPTTVTTPPTTPRSPAPTTTVATGQPPTPTTSTTTTTSPPAVTGSLPATGPGTALRNVAIIVTALGVAAWYYTRRPRP